MADLTWIGTTDGDFTDKANYIVTSTGITPASDPANGDTLRFNDKAIRSVTSGLASTGLTGLIIIGTAGFRYNLGTAGQALEAAFASITWSSPSMIAKFSGNCPILKVYGTGQGDFIAAGGTWGATTPEIGGGNVVIDSGATMSNAVTWQVVGGHVLCYDDGSSSNAPDIEIDATARLTSYRLMGNLSSSGRVVLRDSAAIESGHAATVWPNGVLVHESSGTLPTVTVRGAGTYTIGNAPKVGAVTVMNEHSGSTVQLRNTYGDLTPGTHNYIGRPQPISAGGAIETPALG